MTGRVVWPDDDPGLLAAVLGHCRTGLAGSSEAQAWLARRRLDDAGALEVFGVGFSDRTLGLGLPARVRGRDDDVRGRLQRLGLLRSSGHEHFRGCVTFPVADAAGGVVQVYGRTLLDDARLGAGRHRWLPSVRRGVWNVAGLEDEVIVCDGVIDAFTFWCAGFRSVTAVDGAGGFDDELADTLIRLGVGRVLIAFAADPSPAHRPVARAGRRDPRPPGSGHRARSARSHDVGGALRDRYPPQRTRRGRRR